MPTSSTGGERGPDRPPLWFRRLALAAVVCYVLLVATGGAVRLTGSGLGCPDWPSCYQHRLIAEASFHASVEFYNRMITVAVSVVSVLVVIGAAILRPRRRDLLVRAGAVFGALVAQVVLGGLVVLFALNPYLVALHFLLTLAALVAALSLNARARSVGPREPVALDNHAIVLLRGLVGAIALLESVGTLVSGAGPHAGAQDTKRINVSFRDIAELHSTIALFVIGATLATLLALHALHAPHRLRRIGQILLELLVLQGTLGYLQYSLHDAAVVVELHLVGATVVWCTAVSLWMALGPLFRPRRPAETTRLDQGDDLGVDEPDLALR